MNQMSSEKAFVCFCVEGQSDIDTMKNHFEALFDQVCGDGVVVDFRIAKKAGKEEVGGDLTTLFGVKSENVEKSIYKYFFKNQDIPSCFGWNEITHIIHIVDIDGAYTKDDDILEMTHAEEVLATEISIRNKMKNILYFDDHIAVRKEINNKNGNHIEDIKKRNKQKRTILEYLITLDEISVGKKKVRYSIYYYSANMDHFFHGDANLSGDKKMRNAGMIGRDKTTTEFIDFVCKDDDCAKDGYVNSWQSLRKSNNSLKRGTNINLLINRILNSNVDEWL